MPGTNFYTPKNTTVNVAFTDNSDNATAIECTTANLPSGVAGYAVGCVARATDTGLLYTNTGSTTSCTFTAVNNDTADNITLAEGNMIIGDSSGVGAAVAVSHYVYAGGTKVTADGTAVEIGITGLVSTDLPFVQAIGLATPVVVASTVATSGSLTVTFVSNPGASTLAYSILRATS